MYRWVNPVVCQKPGLAGVIGFATGPEDDAVAAGQRTAIENRLSLVHGTAL